MNISFNTNQVYNNNSIGEVSQQVTTGNNELAKLPEGTNFNGKVVNIANETVTLQLDGNVNVSARLSEFVNLNVGDILNFVVKENNGSSVMIKPQNLNDTMDSMLGKIIENNGFSPTDKNYQIAEALINNNMATDKASMQKIMQASYKFPDSSINDIVALTKLNIPVTGENLEQYSQYLNNQHQINNDINTLSNQVVDFLGAEASGLGDGSLVQENLQKVVDVFFDSPIDKSDLVSLNADNLDNVEGIDATLQDSSNIAADSVSSSEEASDINFNAVDESGLAKANESNEASPLANNLSSIFNVDKDVAGGIEKLLEKAEVSPKDIENAINNSDNKKDLINELTKLITDNDPAKLKELVADKDFMAFIKSSIKSEMSVNPEKMKDPNQIDELYQSNSDKLNKLINSFSSGADSKSQDFSQTAKDMQGKMDFIQNLNNMYAYAQIPMKLAGDDFNSELFVYMNKKAMTANKKDISAMLHLDMDNLGPTDVHVTLSGDEVITRFYVEDERSARIIDEHMNMLQEALKNNGYNLHNETINRNLSENKNSNMVVNELFQNEMEKSVKRFSFDVRM